MCGVSERDINKSLTNIKQPLINSLMEIFINFPRDVVKRTCSMFWLRLEETVAAKGTFRCLMASLYLNK
jgi:hypothetical protein